MKVAVTGASGLVGTALMRALSRRGDEAVAATRGGRGGELQWSTEKGFEPPDALAGFDAVVHLAGASVSEGAWTPARKKILMDSRVEGTKAVVRAIQAAGDRRPKTLISASAQGFYGYHKETHFDESGPPGTGFLAEICHAWEREAQVAETLGVRVVRLRIGLVLGQDGGAFSKMAPMFRRRIGGPMGSGRQWMSWIHLDDVVGMILHALDHDTVEGPMNVAAPAPVRNKEFSEALANALHRSSWLPVPSFALRLALGEMAEIVLEGAYIEPRKALETGYTFRHPTLDGALAALVAT